MECQSVLSTVLLLAHRTSVKFQFFGSEEHTISIVDNRIGHIFLVISAGWKNLNWTTEIRKEMGDRILTMWKGIVGAIEPRVVRRWETGKKVIGVVNLHTDLVCFNGWLGKMKLYLRKILSSAHTSNWSFPSLNNLQSASSRSDFFCFNQKLTKMPQCLYLFLLCWTFDLWLLMLLFTPWWNHVIVLLHLRRTCKTDLLFESRGQINYRLHSQNG